MTFFESCRHSTRLSLVVLDALARRPIAPKSAYALPYPARSDAAAARRVEPRCRPWYRSG